jgi:hypothetical protein
MAEIAYARSHSERNEKWSSGDQEFADGSLPLPRIYICHYHFVSYSRSLPTNMDTTNGNGHINGHTNGHTNGHANGHANGNTDGGSLTVKQTIHNYLADFKSQVGRLPENAEVVKQLVEALFTENVLDDRE